MAADLAAAERFAGIVETAAAASAAAFAAASAAAFAAASAAAAVASAAAEAPAEVSAVASAATFEHSEPTSETDAADSASQVPASPRPPYLGEANSTLGSEESTCAKSLQCISFLKNANGRPGAWRRFGFRFNASVSGKKMPSLSAIEWGREIHTWPVRTEAQAVKFL